MNKEIKPIKTGICSFGMSGRIFHAPFLNCLKEFEFTAVTERHHRNAEKIYPNVKTFTSVEAMLKDEELELIVVNTPNILHYEHAKMALNAGKHVVIEKPFAATSAQAKELTELAEKKSKKLVVFQNRRWDSDFQSVKEVIEGGELGELIEANFSYDRYRIEKSGKAHKEKDDVGVGLIYDLGPHLIDQALVLFGVPKAIFARVQKRRPGSQIDDYFRIDLIYPDLNCTLKSSMLVKEQGPAFILHGTKGSYLKNRSDVQEADLDLGKNPSNKNWGEEKEADKGLLHLHKENDKSSKEYIDAPKGDYALFYKKLFNWIRKEGDTPVDLKDSLLHMEIIEAALRSEREQKVIKIIGG